MAKRKKRGSTRMREFGYSCAVLWFDRVEFELVDTAAKMSLKPLATWIREVAVAAAKSEKRK